MATLGVGLVAVVAQLPGTEGFHPSIRHPPFHGSSYTASSTMWANCSSAKRTHPWTFNETTGIARDALQSVSRVCLPAPFGPSRGQVTDSLWWLLPLPRLGGARFVGVDAEWAWVTWLNLTVPASAKCPTATRSLGHGAGNWTTGACSVIAGFWSRQYPWVYDLTNNSVVQASSSGGFCYGVYCSGFVASMPGAVERSDLVVNYSCGKGGCQNLGNSSFTSPASTRSAGFLVDGYDFYGPFNGSHRYVLVIELTVEALTMATGWPNAVASANVDFARGSSSYNVTGVTIG